MKKIILPTAVAFALTAGFSTTANASLASDAVLSFVDSSIDRTCKAFPDANDPSGCAYGAYDDLIVGSYFTMESGDEAGVQDYERNMITGAGNGVTMGVAQSAGEIDSWNFFGATGYHFTAAAPTIASDDGAGNVTADMNWFVNWNGGNIDMSGGASAVISCGNTCEVNDTFTLDYSAVVPASDPSFGGVAYSVHLEGTIAAPSAVPVPAAVWLFGSGLVGLAGIARRRKAA